MRYKNNNLIIDTKLIHTTIAFLSYYIKKKLYVYIELYILHKKIQVTKTYSPNIYRTYTPHNRELMQSRFSTYCIKKNNNKKKKQRGFIFLIALIIGKINRYTSFFMHKLSIWKKKM